MGSYTDKLEKKTNEELRKLKRRFKRLEDKTWDFAGKKRLELERAEKSLNNVRRIAESITYTIGKKKAMACPAFKSHDKYVAHAKCYAFCNELDDYGNHKWQYSDYRTLYIRGCPECKLTHDQALKKASWSSVFDTPSQ